MSCGIVNLFWCQFLPSLSIPDYHFQLFKQSLGLLPNTHFSTMYHHSTSTPSTSIKAARAFAQGAMSHLQVCPHTLCESQTFLCQMHLAPSKPPHIVEQLGGYSLLCDLPQRALALVAPSVTSYPLGAWHKSRASFIRRAYRYGKCLWDINHKLKRVLCFNVQEYVKQNVRCASSLNVYYKLTSFPTMFGMQNHGFELTLPNIQSRPTKCRFSGGESYGIGIVEALKATRL